MSNKNIQGNKEWIIHIDGDAFFASCEVARRPDLFGKPVVVGEERGIVTALTYQAKALGIKRGDPIWKIKEDFPNVTILSSHFELYRKFAKNLQEIILPHVEKFEAYSIDECFATITSTCQDIQEKVTFLKKLVQNKLGITYSFGVSTTKTLSKVGSKLNKPNGLVFLLDQVQITEALRNTKIENIWGVGWATDRKLKRYKLKTAYDFINADLRKILRDSYSQNIFLTFEELCGIKHFEVGNTHEHQKSIQSTRTFLNVTSDKKILYGEISRNIEIACSEMRKQDLATNRVYIFLKPKEKSKIYFEKLIELPNYTNSDTTMMKYIERLFDESFTANTTIYKKSGVTMLNLTNTIEVPVDLFNTQESLLTEESKVTSLVDQLRNKYGFGIVSLASSLEVNNKREADYKRRHRKDYYESGLPYPFLGITH